MAEHTLVTQPLAAAVSQHTVQPVEVCASSYPKLAVARYDKRRFGSQDELLLDIKKQHSDTMPLLTILEAYTA